jgi:hypothetical protein
MMEQMMEQREQINVCAKEGEIIIRHGEAKPIFTFKGTSYKTKTVQGFASLVKSKGQQEHAVIFSSIDNSAVAILDDRVQDREQDKVYYNGQVSVQFDEWRGILGGANFSQKEFIEFLQRREGGEVGERDALIQHLKNFRYVTNISGDFTYDSANNYTFMVKVGEAEGTVRIPQAMTANIEVFLDSGFLQEMEVEIEITKPKSENEKPRFALSCPKLKRYLKKANDHEMEVLHAELEGWLVVAGQPA